MTAEQAGSWILEHTPDTFQVYAVPFLSVESDFSDHVFQRMIATNYSFGIERDEEVLALNDLDHRKWTNPLEVR